MTKLDTKAISHLFKLRNDQERWQKYDPSSVSMTLFNEIPIIPIIQRAKFKTDLTANKNLNTALENSGYNYSFDKNVLIKLIEEDSKDSELPIIIACFQLISLLYTSKSTKETDNQISTDAFSLFMQILNFNYIEELKIETDFLFRSLLEASLQTKDFEWNKTNIDLVLKQFNQNKSLTKNFYPLFCKFSSEILESEHGTDYYPSFIDYLSLAFQENRDICDTDQIFQLIKYLKPLILELNPMALYVLSEISKRIDYEVQPKSSAEPRQSLTEILDQLPPLFDSKTVDSAENFSLTENADNSEIHNHPPTISSKEIDNYKFNYEFVDEKLFENESVTNLPSELIPGDSFSLFKRFDSEVIKSIDTFSTFLENSSHKWSYHFLHILMQYIIEENQKSKVKYHLIASFLLLLKKLIESKQIDIDLSQYLPSLFDENSEKPVLFDSRNTVFGPHSLDSLLNDFRSSIIELLLLKKNGKIIPMNKICLFKLLKIQNFKPFLITETMVRIIYRVGIDELLDSNDIVTDDVNTFLVSTNEASNTTVVENESNMKGQFSFVNDLLSTVSKTALTLKKLNAPIESRNAITTIILELLRNKSSFYSCLTSIQFVDCLFAFVFENGLSQIFLTAIYKSLLLLDKTNKISPLEYLVNLMFQTVEFIASKENSSDSDLEEYVIDIKEKIFDIVSFSARLIPKLSKLYERFLIPILYDVSSVKLMNRAIYLIISFSSKKNFVLDMSVFNLLVEKIEYLKFINIINLIGMSSSLSSSAIFMIRRPCFLPLLFIKFCSDNNNNQCDEKIRFREDAIDLLKELALYSEYNRRALHDGKVDSILLSYVNNESPIYMNGVQIHLDYQDKLLKKDAWYLLNLIIPAKSSNEIVSHIVSIMTSPPHVISGISNSYDINTELYRIVSKSINHPKPSFEIGNIRAFCFANNIDSSYFRDTTFTVAFMMKADPLLLNKSTSQVMIVSLFDNSKRRFSIVLMNNGLYASYEANKQNTVVPLVQRSNPNEWAFYTFMFVYKKNKAGNGIYLITSYKNMERQHDSEFCNIKFDATPDLTLVLGGFSYSDRCVRNEFERCASIANLSILPGAPKTRDDIINILLQNHKAQINYIFTTNNFPNSLTNRTDKMVFNNKEVEVQLVRNIYENTTVETFLPNYSFKLIDSFKTIDQSMFKYITPILSFSLQYLNSTQLITKFASILLSDQMSIEKLNFLFYKSLFDITSVLYSNEKRIVENNRNAVKKKIIKRESSSDSYIVTNCWSKLIVYNIEIWKRSKEFPQILEFLSSTICNFYIQNLFTTRSDFFSYFLYQLSNIVNENKEENNEIIDQFILFLSRVAYIQLTKEDCSKLFSLFSNIETKTVLIHYLKLIQNISQSIAKSGFKGLNDFSTIYSLIETYSASENENVDNNGQIDIVVNLILILHELYGKDFHTKIVKIVRAFSMASSAFIKKLFSHLESLIDEYPNLFTLTTLIAFQYRIIIDSGITRIPLNDKFSPSELWFVFPCLLAIANFSPKMLKESKEEEENDNIKLSTKLFDFIAESSLKGDSIDSVTNFINVCSKRNLTLNNEIKNDENGYLIESPLYYYLNCLINKIFAQQIENKDVFFDAYFNTVASLFYHLDIKILQYEKANMDPMQHIELLYVNKSSFQTNFIYHLCMNENQEIVNINLLNHAIQLAYKHIDLFGHLEKLNEKNKKPNLLSIGKGLISNYGDNSKNVKNNYSIQDINELLLLFKAKNDKQHIQPQLYIHKFVQMNSIFDWICDTLKQKFKDDFDATSELITSKLLYNISSKYPLYDKNEWITFAKSKETKPIPKHHHKDRKKSPFELLPILNFCYCPFMRQNKKIVDNKAEDEELIDFFENINHCNDENVDFEPNAFNIVYGRKVPVTFRIESDGVFINDQFISYSVFKFILSMNRSQNSKGNQNDNKDLINNSILFILTNGISFLLQFIENSNYFIQSIKKQRLPPHCFIAHSKDEMIDFLKPICISWQSSLISTFDFLNVLNLMDGRTYLSCEPESNEVLNRHYPIFPSIEYLKAHSKSSDQDAKQLFANPEIYYLIDEYPEAYENRKILEKSQIIHEFVQIAFPDFFENKTTNNNQAAAVASGTSNQPSANIRISPRNPFSIHPISIQKVEIGTVLSSVNDSTMKFSRKLLFISKVNIPNYPPIFAFVFNNGPIVFGQVTFDKSDNLCFDPIVTKDFSMRKVTEEGKKVISSITAKHGIIMKFVKSLKFAEYETGIIFHDMVSLRTLSIKNLSSSPISIPSPATQSQIPPASNPPSKMSQIKLQPPPPSVPPRRSRSNSNSNSSIQISLPASDSSVISSAFEIAATNSNANSGVNRAYAKISLTEDNFFGFEQFLFAQSIFLRNRSTVSTATFGQLESSIVDLAVPAANVTCIAQSRRFSVFAFGLDDGRVVVHGVCPGVRVSTIRTCEKQDDEDSLRLIPLPTKVLITDNCGMILVYTSTSKLIVSTLSGTVLKSIDKFNNIVSWFCFVPASEQVDFVGFVGSKLNGDDQKVYGNNFYLCYFEAAKPDEVHCIAELPRNCQKFEIQFDKMRNAFIVASYQREIIVIPMPEIESEE